MATSAWSLVMATAALSWWLLGTTRGTSLYSPQVAAYWLMHQPSASEVGLLDNDNSIASSREEPLSHRMEDWDQASQKFQVQGVMPYAFRPMADNQRALSKRREVLRSRGKQDAAKRQNYLKGSLRQASQKRWLNTFGRSSVETLFPLPERRQFPEVDWRGFNEDVFHESFGDFNPMKRGRRMQKAAKI